MTQTKSLKNKIYQNYGHKDKQKIWIVLYVKVNSKSREFHRWMHLNTWALMKHTHSYTHLPSLHQLTLRGEKEGRAHSTKHFTVPEKPETKQWHGNCKMGKSQEALFSWFLFSLTNIHKEDSSVNKMDHISRTCTYFFQECVVSFIHKNQSIQFKY